MRKIGGIGRFQKQRPGPSRGYQEKKGPSGEISWAPVQKWGWNSSPEGYPGKAADESRSESVTSIEPGGHPSVRCKEESKKKTGLVASREDRRKSTHEKKKTVTSALTSPKEGDCRTKLYHDSPDFWRLGKRTARILPP